MNPDLATDYVSPNLATVSLDEAFPEITVGKVASLTWPYMRRGGGHKWYVDRRNPTVGFVSRDEAMILYNTALLFQGEPCLEIGCWRGWSTAHIARGSGSLDVIDPVLRDPDFLASVRASLTRAGVADRVLLHAEASPEAVDRLALASAKRWSFAFIDGDHEGDAPLRDAEAVARHAADTAVLMFHDLLSPSVAAAFDYLRNQGWKTRLYLTMQVMGVAWRGNVEPVTHMPDLAQHWTLPPHLVGYDVSGVDGRTEMPDSHEAALHRLLAKHVELLQRLAAAEQRHVSVETPPAATPDEFDRLHGKLVEMAAQLARLSVGQDVGAAQAESDSRTLAAQTIELTRLREAETEWLVHMERLRSREQQLAALNHEVVLAREAADEAQASLARARGERNAALAIIEQLQAKQAQLIEELTRRTTTPSAEPTAAPLQVFEHVSSSVGPPDPRGLALAQSIARRRALFGLARRAARSTQAARQKAIEMARQHGIDGDPAHVLAEWLARPRVALGLLRRSVASGDPDRARALVLDKLEEVLRGTAPACRQAPGEAGQLHAELTDLHRRHDRTLAVLAELEAAKVADEEALLELRIQLAAARAG